MQNEKSKGIRSFMKGKGYYIVLLLCAVAVGVSGYFLFKNDDPVVTTPKATTSQKESQNNNTEIQGHEAKDAIATQGSEAAQSAQAEELNVTRPVGGEQVYAFAADKLAYNETTKDWRTHEAADYSAAIGTTVAAAADGTVYAIYEDESFGMTVVMQHTGGYTTYYSNLAPEVSVSVGQTVQAGGVLGTVGNTACVETAAQPHLHFAVCQNNVPMDPEEFLQPG